MFGKSILSLLFSICLAAPTSFVSTDNSINNSAETSVNNSVEANTNNSAEISTDNSIETSINNYIDNNKIMKTTEENALEVLKDYQKNSQNNLTQNNLSTENNKEGIYTCTAQLDTNLNNIFQQYDASIEYELQANYPTYVHNPNTLELPFGEEWSGEFPTEVLAFMKDGSQQKVKVGEWQAIRAFNEKEEGIYVYGANIVDGEDYQVVRSELQANENHEDKGSNKEAYIYDVYYRISYFKTKDNFNAYVRSMEKLNRGVYAIPSKEGVFVSWRLLATEYGKEIDFFIYRNGKLVNQQPITTKTNYIDKGGKAGDTYVIEKVQNGKTEKSEAIIASDKNYLSIPVQRPDPLPDKDGTLCESYTLNDAGAADVDGDGEYEIIVKWYPSNGFDSGKAKAPSSPTIFDIYKIDGTPLWRLNMGLEMPSGAHFNQFMLYDLDEDGKAELFLKTSDGTVSYKPNAEGKFDITDESTIVSYIGDKSVIPGTNINKNGHANSNTNEYVTVFNGLTGQVIDSIPYENTTGRYEDWHASGKNDGGNRSARYNIAIAYLPKEKGSTETIPAVLFNRGYYAKTTVIAYTLRNGKLTKEWNFVAESGSRYAGKGNHNVSTGDLDNDGFDELVIGALALDHDGTVLWVKDGENGYDFSGHADTIHLSAMFPDSKQLYVMTPSEDGASTMNYTITNAATGARVTGIFLKKADVGRGIAANITPKPGFELWSSIGSAMYNVDGSVTTQQKPTSHMTTNWRMYWDGDLLSELPDSQNPGSAEGAASVFKYNWDTNKMDRLVVFSGTKMNNSTKNTACLTADLFGDWREEMVVRSSDNTELRIYMTNIETDYMIYTLMHDPVYRNAVANQNTSYNQPPHLSFYLGEDIAEKVLNMQLPVYSIAYPKNSEDIEKVDKSTLQEAIIKAKEYQEKNYTKESYAAMQEALKAAEEIVGREEVTQEEVNEQEKKLSQAIKALEAVKEEEKVDKTALNAVIEQAKALKEEDYTKESYAVLQEALKAVEEIAGKEDTTQDTVNQAVESLESAIISLVKLDKIKPVLKITLDSSQLNLIVDKTVVLTAVIEPEDADDKTLVWSSSDNKIVTVEDGKITAVNIGTATITVTSTNKKSVDCKVTVVAKLGDVNKSGWEYSGAEYVYLRGIMTGKSFDQNGNVKFAPNDNLTREEFAQILYAAEGKPEIEYTPIFTDVKEEAWYSKAILWAAGNGIVSGYGNGKFGVGDKITREQLAAILYQYAKYKKYDITSRVSLDYYTDTEIISDWAVEQLRWAVANGVVSGKGTKLDSSGSATRAECAAMLRTFLVKFQVM